MKRCLRLYISVKRQILPEGRYESKVEGECFAPFQNLFENQSIFWISSVFLMNFSTRNQNLQMFWKLHFFCHTMSRCHLKCSEPFGQWNFDFIWLNDWHEQYQSTNIRVWHENDYFYVKSLKNSPRVYISVKRQISPEGRYESKVEGECFAPFKNLFENQFIFWISTIFLMNFST